MKFSTVRVIVLVWLLWRKRRKLRARKRFYLTRTSSCKPEESAEKHFFTSGKSGSVIFSIGFNRTAFHSLLENFERHWTRQSVQQWMCSIWFCTGS